MPMRLRPALGIFTAVASVATIIGYAASALSADHQDGPATTAEPPADINDVYSWIDGSNVVLAMTVYPAAPTGAQFSDNVQYVFHTASAATGLGTVADPVDVIATFDATQKIKLWVGTSEYVTGDASPTAGLTSADGMVKVFAGLRAESVLLQPRRVQAGRSRRPGSDGPGRQRGGVPGAGLHRAGARQAAGDRSRRRRPGGPLRDVQRARDRRLCRQDAAHQGRRVRVRLGRHLRDWTHRRCRGAVRAP